MLRAFDQPIVQVQIRVYLTDSNGSPLDAAKSLRRRKAICRHWWNHEWLSRLIGVVQWLHEGVDGLCLADTMSGRLVIASAPLRLTAQQGIDEQRLKPAPTIEDDETLEDGYEEQEESDLADERTDVAP